MIKVALFAEILIKDFDGAARTFFQLIDRIDREDYSYMAMARSNLEISNL